MPFYASLKGGTTNRGNPKSSLVRLCSPLLGLARLLGRKSSILRHAGFKGPTGRAGRQGQRIAGSLARISSDKLTSARIGSGTPPGFRAALRASARLFGIFKKLASQDGGDQVVESLVCAWQKDSVCPISARAGTTRRVNNLTDQQLIRDYAEGRSEAAFAELARRHVDLVYSAAVRILRDADLAKDVTQGVFLALAQNAPQLTDRAVIASWLHFTTRNLAVKTIRSDARRRAREQEAAAMNATQTHKTDDWEHIAPQLDDVLVELSEPDRDAVVLRYFQRKSAEEMAEILGISAEAAQKRVNRAVERLRDAFAKRGVAAGAVGIVAVVSANAVQAAPVGLAALVSTAATLAGTTATVATTTKIIAMTTLQKTAVSVTIAVLAIAGIYEAREASLVRQQIESKRQNQSELEELLRQLRTYNDYASNRLAAANQELAQLKAGQANSQLLKLRSEVTLLRGENENLAKLLEDENNADPSALRARLWLAKLKKLKDTLQAKPQLGIPELAMLTDQDWLDVVSKNPLNMDSQIQNALSELRKKAKEKFGPMLSRALREYAQANSGQLPPDTAALKPYIAPPVEKTVLDRYQMLQTGTLNPGEMTVGEKAPVDETDDFMFKVGAMGMSYQNARSNAPGSASVGWSTNDLPLAAYSQVDQDERKAYDDELKSFADNEAESRDEKTIDAALKAFSADHNGGRPETPDELRPYVKTPAEKAAFDRLVARDQ